VQNRSDTIQEFCWYTSRRFRVNFFKIVGLIIIYQSITGIFLRDNDFLWHYNHGKYFIEGDILKHSGAPNTLGRLMMDATLGIQNYYTARAFSFSLALAALLNSLLMWNRMANKILPITNSVAFAAAVFSLGLFIHFVLRDLDDCGLQIFLLFFLTSASYAISSGRSILSGFWLGVAATYKVTPLLFLPFLMWKRQWQAALWMIFFIIALNLTPAVFMGWEKTVSFNLNWLKRTKLDLTVQDPSHPTSFEVPRHQNQSLPFSIARYLQTYPPGHSLYIDHPLFLQFGNLKTATANYVVKSILLVFSGILAWRFRHPWKNESKRDNFLSEWATVMLLCALLSPLNWIYHYVLALPALFLTLRAHLSTHFIPRWRSIILGIIGFKVLLLHRFFLGHDLSIIMLSYKFDAFAMLLLMMLVLTISTEKSF